MNRLMDRLVDPFPWLTFLPEAARAEFVREFLTTARACAAIGRFDRQRTEFEVVFITRQAEKGWQDCLAVARTPVLTPGID